MTDEEAKEVVTQALQVDEDYGDMCVEMKLVKAGYRKGLHQVLCEMHRLSCLPDEERTHGDDWKDLQDWLESKLKE